MVTSKLLVIPLATLVQHLDDCFEKLGYKEVFLNRRDWDLVKANLRTAVETPETLEQWLARATPEQRKAYDEELTVLSEKEKL